MDKVRYLTRPRPIAHPLTDNSGDMNKTIYRHLADQKWRSYKRKIVMQRLEQMSVTPDVLPPIDPTASVDLAFGRRNVQPGGFVESTISQFAPNLSVQLFHPGQKLVTIVVVDSDVPNVAEDSFDTRAHGIWVNVPIEPNSPQVFLAQVDRDQHQVLSWLPPFAQKGSPYHRLSVWVLDQGGRRVDAQHLRSQVERDFFSMRHFVAQGQHQVLGATMFRTKWDDGMRKLMKDYDLPGRDEMLQRKPAEKLPYKRRDTTRMRG